MKLDKTLLRKLPKVLLHEHLDGVLRPETVIELAKSAKYLKLPTNDPQALAQWFHQGANQGSLAKYLEGFGPRLEGFDQVALNDLAAARAAVTQATAAILVEPDGG